MVDYDRPLEDSQGRPARLIGTLSGPAPYAVAIEFPGGERIGRFDADGNTPDGAIVIVNRAVADTTVWVNVYIRPDGTLAADRSEPTKAGAEDSVRDERRLVGRNQITLRAVFD